MIAGTSPLDADHLASLRETYGEESFAHLRQLFLEETRGRVAALRAALDAGNDTELRAVAHRMVSLLGAFGARTQAELARRIADADDGTGAALAPALIAATQEAHDAVLLDR